MARSKGKQKGSAFERKVCKQLSLWISKGQREDLFWRSAMSGGRATVGRKGGKDHAKHAGDITATDPLGHTLTDHWYVECKSYLDLNIAGAMITGAGPLVRFWRETCEQATHYKRMPMLIAHQNQYPTIVMVPTAHLLNPYGSALYPKSHLGRFTQLRCDVLDWELMLKLPYEVRKEMQSDFTFLNPGDLERILGPAYGKKKPKVKRERMPIKRLRL